MTVIKKVFLLTILIMFFSFSFCYAIDENQLTSSMDSTITTTQPQVDSIPEEITSQTENAIDTTSPDSSFEESTSSLDSLSSSDSDSQASTSVSSVSPVSKTSTMTNILNIALIVVGILLIFLAIAILIRLNS